MKLPCWFVGHRRERESRFIRRLDGYPLAIYRPCKNCDKRLNLVRGQGDPPLKVALALELTRDD